MTPSNVLSLHTREATSILVARGPLTSNALAKILKHDRSTLRKLLLIMERKGLVTCRRREEGFFTSYGRLDRGWGVLGKITIKNFTQNQAARIPSGSHVMEAGPFAEHINVAENFKSCFRRRSLLYINVRY